MLLQSDWNNTVLIFIHEATILKKFYKMKFENLD